MAGVYYYRYRYGYSIEYKLWWLMMVKRGEGWRGGLTT